MSTFVPTILPALDYARSIAGGLGMRVFTVTVRRRVWTGGRPGAPGATKTDTDTVLTNTAADGSLKPVRVQELSRRDVLASGGQLSARHFRVGPMTPPYVASPNSGGFDDTEINPVPGANQAELIWILSANDGGTHGIPPGGIICELEGEEATSMHYYALLRSTGRAPT